MIGRADRLRRGPFREGAFTSRLHSERLGAILGVALGVTFGVCFLTGLLSHLIQHPPGWFHWTSRPAGVYRVTQGLHVATGIASIPLLLAKLWVVYPHLWRWPPIASVAHALERLSLVPLVGGSVFLLFSGVASIIRWFPWHFSFPRAHYWASWAAIGGLLVHIGAKAASTRRALGREDAALAVVAAAEAGPEGGLSRRGFLGAVAAAVGVLTVATVGQAVRPLSGLSALAPRDPDVGPQGFPINRTAHEAHVERLATDLEYRLLVEGRVADPLALSMDELRAMPMREATLPIPCVDGWNVSKTWRGVPVADLLARAGASADLRDGVLVESVEPKGAYRVSMLDPAHARDPDTLLALEVEGEPLALDHGFPLRLITPNAPGVMQTKWVGRLEVR